MSKCAICERDVSFITKHHLIPKQKGGRETINVCKPCQKQIHALFTNYILKIKYSSIEKIKNNPDMKKFINWIKNKDIETVRASRRY